MCFAFQITGHQIPLDSSSLNLVVWSQEHLQPIDKNCNSTSDLSLIFFAISSTIDMREIPKSVILFWYSNSQIINSLGTFSSSAFLNSCFLVEADFYQKCLCCYNQASQDVVKGLLVMLFYHIQTYL